jgi:hypothetical protein
MGGMAGGGGGTQFIPNIYAQTFDPMMGSFQQALAAGLNLSFGPTAPFSAASLLPAQMPQAGGGFTFPQNMFNFQQPTQTPTSPASDYFPYAGSATDPSLTSFTPFMDTSGMQLSSGSEIADPRIFQNPFNEPIQMTMGGGY